MGSRSAMGICCLIKTLCHGNGSKHRLSFINGFLVLPFGGRVIDPASAGLHVGLPALEQSRANGDTTIQIPVEGEIPNAASVRTTSGLFQLRDDLHGPDFRGAAQSA